MSEGVTRLLIIMFSVLFIWALITIPTLKASADSVDMWVRVISGANWDKPYTLVIDRDNSVYVLGETLSYGVGAYDLILAKVDRNGSILWIKTIGGAGSEVLATSSSMAIDSYGNVYVIATSSSFDLEKAGLLVVKINSYGDIEWSKAVVSTSAIQGRGLAIGSDGSIYVVGSIDGNILVVRLDKDGVIESAKIIEKPRIDYPIPANFTAAYNITDFIVSSALVDPEGHLYIVGYYEIYFVSPTYSVVGDSYIFVAKMDQRCNLLWLKFIDGPEWNRARAAAIDSEGNIYIVGSKYLSTDISVPGGYPQDIILIKLGREGDILWGKAFGGEHPEEGFDIYVDPSDSVYVIGYTSSYSPANFPRLGAFILKLDKDSGLDWARVFILNYSIMGLSIASDNQGNVFFAGAGYAKSYLDPPYILLAKFHPSYVFSDFMADVTEKVVNNVNTYTAKVIGQEVEVYNAMDIVGIADIRPEISDLAGEISSKTISASPIALTPPPQQNGGAIGTYTVIGASATIIAIVFVALFLRRGKSA